MEAPPDGQLSVLLIEDNPGDARLIGLLLEETGVPVRVHWADRLATGVARLAQEGARPAAVLLDLSLPDSQGLETFDRAREAAPDLPIVVLSGLADETMAVRAVAAGAQDYLVKGRVDGDGLLRALRYAIERQRAAEERKILLARERAARADAERLAAERAAILGQIADGVIIADPAGRVTFANAAARRLYAAVGADLAPGQPIGAARPLAPAGAPDAPDDLPLARALRGETVLDAEWSLQRPSGKALAVLGSAAPVTTDDGARLGAVLTFRDVTARRDLERQKEEFFANASHDLRTPLTVIKTSIGVILEHEPAGTTLPMRRLFANIADAANEMGQLIEDLLQLARLETGRAPFHPMRGDLRDLARRAARAIAPLAEARGQRLELALPAAAAAAAVDAALLERALVNLVGNAQKYGRDGGWIRLSVAPRGNEWVLAVADDGPGIAPEDQERIFERFYRPRTAATRGTPGTGLGLPIVRATAALHGGYTWVESTPGAGATFFLALPAAEATVGARGEREESTCHENSPG